MISVIILFCSPPQGSLIASRGIHHLGRISYSLYLFQQFAFAPHAHLYGEFSWLQLAVLVLLVAVLVEVWFTVAEEPIRLLGVRRFPRPVKRTFEVEPVLTVGSL